MHLKQDLYLSRVPLIGFVTMGLVFASFAGQVPVIKSQIGASDAFYGLLVLFGSSGAVAAIWLAPLADRWLGRAALSFGIAVMGLSFIGVGLSTTPLSFVCLFLLASMGAGITDVLMNADISNVETRTGRALMNLNHGCFSLAYALGALVTGGLREAGWTPVEIFGAVAVLLVGMSVFARRPARGTGHPPEGPDTGGLALHLFVITAGVVVMAAFLAEAATEGWSALHLERTLGGGAAQGAMGPAILGLSMGAGRLGGHWLSNRLPDVPTMCAALLLSALGLCLAGFAPSLSWAYLGFAMAGLGMSVVGPLGLSLLGRSVAEAARLKAISRASAIAYFAFFAGPSVMGFVSELFGLRMSFVTIAAILLVVAVWVVPSFGRQAEALRRNTP